MRRDPVKGRFGPVPLCGIPPVWGGVFGLASPPIGTKIDIRLILFQGQLERLLGDNIIRVGLVGFGMAGRVFHAPLISSAEGLELTAVVERNSDNAAQRYPGITTYRSLEAMLADSSLDLFVVATPSGTHFQVARQILEAGKNVVVDKPVAVASAEVAKLIAPGTPSFPQSHRGKGGERKHRRSETGIRHCRIPPSPTYVG